MTLSQRAQPDIVVISPDGEYLMVVEVKLGDNNALRQAAIRQIKQHMVATDCAVGLVVLGDRAILLRDSLEQSHGESIYIAGEGKIPGELLPLSVEQRQRGHEFEVRVQQWLERLKAINSAAGVPENLRDLFDESILNLLRLGEVRVAYPRWLEVAG